MFAHLPVLLNKDGSKLSKRQADICIQNYRDEDCSPLALANFVTKSGGGFYHNVDKLLTLDELAEQVRVAVSYANHKGFCTDSVRNVTHLFFPL